MKPLTPQTVYKDATNYNGYTLEHNLSHQRTSLQKHIGYFLSKEELISFAEEVWQASKMHTIYRETPAPIGVTWDAPIPPTKEQFINNIIG